MKEILLKIYDTHLNLAGNDFVMYRLIHINRSMGGGTFGLPNGLGGQSIVHTQWVPPPNSIVNLNVPPPMNRSQYVFVT